MKFRANAPLLIGIGLPVLMVLFVAVSIYLPSLLAKKPTYNFIYSVDDHSYYDPGSVTYDVEFGKLIERAADTRYLPQGVTEPNTKVAKPSLYFHDVGTNQSRQITAAEAMALNLSNNNQAPDGYTVTRGDYGGGFFPFFGSSGESSANKYYIKKGNHSQELNLNLRSPQSYYYFRFLGWVI